MELPFALHFLKKVELFQVLKKLDRQFSLQLKENDGTVPLWEGEKKVLHWSYKNNKHLGSPLIVDDLRSKKSFAIKTLGYSNEAESLKALLISDNEFEIDFEKVLKGLGLNQHTIKLVQDAGNQKEDLSFTADEIDKIGVRKIFGNLVSRGYASFYPEVSEELDHYESQGSSTGMGYQRGVYKNVTTTQSNCEGILITKEGSLMGELVNDIYKLGKQDTFDSDAVLYQKQTNTEHYLARKITGWYFYQSFIVISYLALLVIIWLILKGVANVLLDVGKIGHYFSNLFCF